MNPLAVDYVQRAGRLYGWALRLFLMVVPAVTGVVQPLALLPATIALNAIAVMAGADIIRVHDVREHRLALEAVTKLLRVPDGSRI